MIHVAAACDAGYLPWCATMLLSCLDQHPRGEVTCHFLDVDGLATADAASLRRVVEGAGGRLLVHEVEPSALAAIPAKPRFGGRAVWARLLLPDLLDEPRVLYLDADTFVVSPLDELWATDLGGAALGAVANVVEPSMWPFVRSLGVADPRDTLNSGVLLLDLAALREDRGFDTALAFAAARGEDLPWADQDALNATFDGRWHHLHPRWNAQNSLWTWRPLAEAVFGAEAVQRATTAPAVVHFEGPHVCKPWHYLSEHPWRDAYRRTLARTPWAGTPPTDRTAVTRLIRRLPGDRRIPAYLWLLRARDRREALRRADLSPAPALRRLARRARAGRPR